MLKLRPHHILDIVRNIGHGIEPKPHEYGHLVHEITRLLMEDPEQYCQLVIANDDICGPCIHLDGNRKCRDMLGQLETPVSKQDYNDKLDRSLLRHLEIQPDSEMRVADFLHQVAGALNDVVEICTHPKENKEYRFAGLSKGLETLKIL